MKKLILLGLVSLLSTGTVFAQKMEIMRETRTNFGRSLHIYSEGNSGTLVNGTAGYFSGNELEVGVQYSQNFETALWLNLIVQGAVLGTVGINNFNHNGNEIDGAINPDYTYNGRQNGGISFKDVELGLQFSHYYYLGIDHNFLMKNLFVAPFQFGGIHFFNIISELELQPFYIGTIKNPGDPSFEADGQQTRARLQLFSIGLEYKVKFHPMWAYATKLTLRSTGETSSIGGSTLPFLWDVDSLTAFRSNLHIRWDNTVYFNMDNGFYLWGSVRYQALNLIPHPANTEGNQLMGKTLHDVYLRFGLGYKFDI